jgi:hypothetical protein
VLILKCPFEEESTTLSKNIFDHNSKVKGLNVGERQNLLGKVFEVIFNDSCEDHLKTIDKTLKTLEDVNFMLIRSSANGEYKRQTG